ncbi:MAG: nucleotidyltransferase domain-containing protein [Planctomycetes bacterium]|nr:nucleotidyltransferase domain-containing protein [Planctomycetota bacterium]MCB9936564.1 nucleotidyltransferase domain-containing protein [Planctomycetota bacterium]
MIEFTAEQMASLSTLCRQFGVRRLDLFGSATRGDFDPATSDLDFLVEFDYSNPMGGFNQYFGLKQELESLFGLKVDLVCENAVSNRRLRRAMEKSRKHLYAA